jgi:hypothetical protein
MGVGTENANLCSRPPNETISMLFGSYLIVALVSMVIVFRSASHPYMLLLLEAIFPLSKNCSLEGQIATTVK